MAEVNLNQITLPTRDVGASVQFYERMGFALIVRSPHYARFECPEGDATFSVHLVDHEIPESGVVVYFECGDLDRTVSSLETLGFSFSQPATDQPWLWREARLRDPAGNVICLFSAGQNRKNPPWRMDRAEQAASMAPGLPSATNMEGRYFNPDDYLETESGREFTPERSAAAFDRAYTDLELALRSAPAAARLFVVVGVQGAGKTTWIRQNAATLAGAAFFFDAALPRRIHRARAIAIARATRVPVTAVWVRASLDVALARNQSRRDDHRVPESAIRSVYSMLEPPSTIEGFEDVLEVGAGA